MKTVKVWDPFVRFFHWFLVVGIILQLATAEELKNVHAKVGYLIIVLLILRVIWGFLSAGHARFTDFVYPPADILAYLKSLIQGKPRHYIGHNPAGGAMVCALLLIFMLTTLSGLKSLGADGNGPLARRSQNLTARAWADDHPYRNDDDHSRYGTSGGDERHTHDHAGNKAQAHFWKEIHEALVGISLFLVALHICGVLASSYVHRENLILAMITGKKKVP